MLSERSQAKKNMYKILENANQSMMTENKSVVAWDDLKEEGWIIKRHF